MTVYTSAICYNYSLSHTGVKGMRWGIRKHHDKYGRLTKVGTSKKTKLQKEYDELSTTPTITSAGKKRMETIQKDYQTLTGRAIAKRQSSESIRTHKSVHNMSNEELQQYNTRKRLEKDYSSYQTPEQLSVGRKFASGAVKNVVKPVAVEVGRAYLYGVVGMTLPGLKKTQTLKVKTK